MCDSPEDNVRCNLDNKFNDTRDSIKSDNLCVYARVRPLLPQEKAKGYKECVAAIDEQTVRVVVPTTSSKYKSSRQTEDIIEDYTFSAAFGPETGQFVFFQETMLNIMSNFVEGSNSMIFSYGITGSGKTYTLQGDSENPGIIPLSLKLFFAVADKQLMRKISLKPYMYSEASMLSESEIQKEFQTRDQLLSLYDEECERAPGSFRNNNNKTFAMFLCNLFSDDFVAEQRQTTLGAEEMASAQASTLMKEVVKKSIENQPGACSVWVSFIEIYNETIYDLLQPISNYRPKLSLGEDKSGNVYVKGATEVCVFDSEEALKILNIGRKHLSIASTKMNYQSSRSHCIYTIRVIRVADQNNMSQARVNRLSFCDLAGSERASKTQTTGVRLKEANAINTSLLVLGRCLEHLRLSQMSRDKRLIPFRESKLTRIFSNFFLGQGKAAMVANASPSDYTFDETIHVLKFSALAKKILVNDTFLSNASTTIQSICTQLGMHRANSSAYNESMESIESDSELIIQEKDELIEKLLQLAGNFAKKEKEMNDMEMRIRREACEEYAQLREELLEMQKIRYEEEIAAIKEIYEMKLTKQEERYEKIIKSFKDQLSESEESFLNDQSLDTSKSFEVVTDTRKSYSKSENEFKKMAADLKVAKETTTEIEKENESLKDTIESLEKEIKQQKAINATLDEMVQLQKSELEKLRESIEAEEKKHAAEKNELKSTMDEKLQKEVLNYTEKISLLEKEMEALLESNRQHVKIHSEKIAEKVVEVKNAEKIIHDQSEAISTLENDAEVLRKEIENLERKLADSKKAFDMELEKEKEKHEKEISEARGAAMESSSLKLQFEKDLEEKNEKITSLLQELDTANKNYNSLQEELKVKETASKDMQKDMETLQSEVKNLEKNIAELKELKESSEKELDKEKEKHKQETLEAKNAVAELSKVKLQYQTELEKKNEKISCLEQELNAANKNLDTMQKELKIRETVSKELEKEIDTLKQAIDKMQKEMENSISSKLEVENKVSTLMEELKVSQEKSEQLSSKLKDLENNKQKLDGQEEKYQKLEDDCRKLRESNEALILEKANLQNELLVTKDNIEILEKINLEKMAQKEEEYETLTLQAESQKKELEEKIDRAITNMELMEQDMQEKTSTVLELEKQIKSFKVAVETLKKERENLESNNLELKSEIDSYKEKIKDIEDKLASAEKNLDNAQEASQKSSEFEKEICNYKEQIQKLEGTLQITNKEKNDLFSTVEELKNNLQFAEKEKNDLLKTIKELKENMQIAEKEKNNLLASINKLKESQELFEKEKNNLLASVKQSEEKVQLAEKKKEELLGEVNELKESMQFAEKEKNDLQNVVKDLKENLQLAEKDMNNHLATVKESKESLNVVEKEKNDLLRTIKELKESLQFAEKEKSDLLATVNKLKENLQLVEKEKADLQLIISEKAKTIVDIEAELCSDKDKLELAKKELSEKNAQLEALKKEESGSNSKVEEKIAQLEDDIVTLKLKESEFNALKKEYEELKSNLEKIDKEKMRLQTNLDSSTQSLSQLKKEMKEKQTELESVTKKLKKSEQEINALKNSNEKLNLQITEIESEKDNLMKKVADSKISEDKIKELKQTFEAKMLMEKEQHTIEIEETMKLKREVEKENDMLKEENQKIKEDKKLLEEKLKATDQDDKSKELGAKSKMSKVPSKPVTKTTSRTNLLKDDKSKELSAKPKMSKVSSKTELKESGKSIKATNKVQTKESTESKIAPRSLRNKETKLQEVSFSSLDSREPETPEVPKRGKKRVSDEDFDPTKEHASKKIKSSEENSKIPVKRQSKKKLLNEQAENLSPIQKIANTISTKFKSVVESASSKVASPRLTRGRKKLFNPDLATSSKSGKATRAKK